MWKCTVIPAARTVLNQIFNCQNQAKFKYLQTNLKVIASSYLNTANNLRYLQTSAHLRAKLYVDRENIHAYKILQSIPINVEGEVNTFVSCEVDSETELNELLQQNWRSSSASEIVDGFKNALNYCILNNIALSDQRFDNLVDGLMDHVEHLTDDELSELLSTISRYPPSESFKSHNFHDIWSCLDDVCCWRISNWPTEVILHFADHWYKLNLGRVCDYVSEVVGKFSRRPDKLTKDQLVHIFFYINICRKRSIDFAYESALEAIIENMSVDEMAICAMGYFKSQSKIKITSILETMIRKIREESTTIHEVTLCSLLKIIKFSNPFALADQVYDLMGRLLPEVDRLSNLACVHIALLGTGMLVCHKEVLEKITEKLVSQANDCSNIRMKDLERLLLALTIFNLRPNTSPDIFDVVYKEVHRDERLKEIIQYPRCLASTLNYLAMNNMYSHEMINMVLDQDYIIDNYGKPAKLLPRELFVLDKSIDLECPNYTGNRLDAKIKYKASKWLTEYTPSDNQFKKLKAADKFILDVIDHVKQFTGNDKFVQIHHVLPHFPRADIILCKDIKTNTFIEPAGFENYILGDTMYASNTKDLNWYALIIVGWNNTIRNGNEPVGLINFKARQLRIAGYKPCTIIWNEFMRLARSDKIKYIANKLDEC